MNKEYCIAHHDAEMCFVPKCLCHLLLLGNVEELLRKLTHCVSHINMWTSSTHSSSIDSVEIMLSTEVKWLIRCKKQSNLFRETEEWTQCPPSQKSDSWGKSIESSFLTCIRKANSTRTSWSVFAKRVEKNENTKYELDLLKFVERFLDCFGNYISNLKTFKQKSS